MIDAWICSFLSVEQDVCSSQRFYYNMRYIYERVVTYVRSHGGMANEFPNIE